MRIQVQKEWSSKSIDLSFSLDRKLASYVAASASIGVVMASGAKAIVVSNTTPQAVGINGFANIDFNHDGQTDFQIDHDRVDLGGGNIVDYLQIDKNDVNGEGNPLAFDPGPGTSFAATPFQDGVSPRNDANNSAFLVDNQTDIFGSQIQYPAALVAGAEIGPSKFFDYQEGDNVFGTHKIGRLNRLIDEDHGQVDMVLGGKTADQIVTPTNSPQFLGVQNQVRYLGVKMDLNNANSSNPEDPNGFNYGWIGIKITNEANATGEVTGYGYETQPGVAINAGDLAPGTPGDYNGNGKVDGADYVLWRNGGPLQNETVTLGSTTPEDYAAWRSSFGNPGAGAGIGSGGGAVPEPCSLLLSLGTGLAIAVAYFFRRTR